jgi:CxxC motif-containing protein (DUF1111 family)
MFMFSVGEARSQSESPSNRVPPPAIAARGLPGLNDDGGDVISFGRFMDFLAPPESTLPRAKKQADLVAAGEIVFAAIGCTERHTPTWVTGHHPSAALPQQTFHPDSDFLLHDMGSSGDQVQQGTDSNLQPIPPTWMRTTPLWGCRNNKVLWHDGRLRQRLFRGD